MIFQFVKVWKERWFRVVFGVEISDEFGGVEFVMSDHFLPLDRFWLYFHHFLFFVLFSLQFPHLFFPQFLCLEKPLLAAIPVCRTMSDFLDSARNFPRLSRRPMFSYITRSFGLLLNTHAFVYSPSHSRDVGRSSDRHSARIHFKRVLLLLPIRIRRSFISFLGGSLILSDRSMRRERRTNGGKKPELEEVFTLFFLSYSVE